MKRKFREGGPALDPEEANFGPTERKKTFGEAFKEARKNGLKTFQWTKPDGTTATYNTLYENEVPQKSLGTPGGRGTARGQTEGDLKFTTQLPKVSVTGKREKPSIYANSIFATESERPSKPATPSRRAPMGAAEMDETPNPRLLKKDALDAAVKKPAYKTGGGVKKYARGGGIESKGKTKGRMC